MLISAWIPYLCICCNVLSPSFVGLSSLEKFAGEIKKKKERAGSPPLAQVGFRRCEVGARRFLVGWGVGLGGGGGRG